MRLLLIAYAVASLLLAYLGWAANRNAQMNRNFILGTLHRLPPVGVDPVDERTTQLYQRDFPAIDRGLRRTVSETGEFVTYGLVSFVFSILVFIGYSASRRGRVQPSAGGNAAPPRASA